MHNVTYHQKNQIKIINEIEKQIQNKSLVFSTVAPVEDYKNDKRMCLTSVHFPSRKLSQQIKKQIIEPLQIIEPNFYWYKSTSLHLTIKNVRVINNPPNFSPSNISQVRNVFDKVVPQNISIGVYFYRLLLFPNNLALIGTTDPTLDTLFLNLDQELNSINFPDDKKYLNKRYFFCNMTLCRFNIEPSEKFKEKVQEISKSIKLAPYLINTVTLLTSNAVLERKKIINTWSLKEL